MSVEQPECPSVVDTDYISREAICILVTAICSVHVSVCLSVPRRVPTLLHGPGCNLGNGRGCPLVVHCWADLQSVHGFRCCDNMAPNAKCQRVLVPGWSGD